MTPLQSKGLVAVLMRTGGRVAALLKLPTPGTCGGLGRGHRAAGQQGWLLGVQLGTSGPPPGFEDGVYFILSCLRVEWICV